MKIWLVPCLTLTASILLVAAPERGNLRAGAARVEITPSEGNYPPPYKTVLDKIYVRALVLDNGNAKAGLITADAVNMETEYWATAAPRIARETGMAEANLHVSATHSHSAPGW
ncbi:MAG: hypothetical protein NTW28_17925 [Candidatus Solibacter sp.]|nr:hypothetical protein [Candidatus Solibacter sp.]